MALIEALGLGRPALCGFSDGGHVVSLVGMRHQDLATAIINYAGYDLFNPVAASMRIVQTRQGGGDQAIEPEFDHLAERIGADRLARIQRDHDAGQGEGAWRRMFSVEEACQAYRFLAAGELCVLPNLDHSITPAVVAAAVEFLVRHKTRS